MPTAETLRIVREVRQSLAGRALTPRQARLYSQRLRREMDRDGLRGFGVGDIAMYFDEAMLLLHCALIEAPADLEGAWREGVKRAGEILEWLSQQDLKPAGVPVHLLAAAAYQLAGYPAMALAQLRLMPENEPFSTLLRDFLRGRFSEVLKAVWVFWRDQRNLEALGLIAVTDLSVQAVRETVRCIGVVCNYFRTGSDDLVERALLKLDRLATTFLYSRDSSSYLLARLTAAASRHYVDTCLWPRITELRQVSTPLASDALIQFARAAVSHDRVLVWPSQAKGIERLRQNTSFVLATPTGSGKTMVATLAVIQGLFAEAEAQPPEQEGRKLSNLILYLVPSRALASEVEGRLALDLAGIAAERIVVTGLYGGIDWGPTDAWIQTDEPTILICTYEKADALLRYLGVLFLHRVRLVVIDEVHMVEQDTTRLDGLSDGASRAYRLEQLGTRLSDARARYNFRLVALSAVAARAAPALARWISADRLASPTTSDYRSTRQMLGRLEVSQAGQFSIHYDLMDGRSLRFGDERALGSPFVPAPFPPVPGGLNRQAGPEVAMQIPTLWAALHLAAERPDGTRPSVLISVTQNPDAFASRCADQLEAWPIEQLPAYRSIDEADERWTRCLASAADYFTEESVEYRLLRLGVALHHGKMPGLLARRLKTLIDRGYVRVVIATSTLSEGVNIPVNYLLVPNLYRATTRLSRQEFTNLIGRVGRPGIGTEGHALAVLPDGGLGRQRVGYRTLQAEIEASIAAAGVGMPEDAASSALAHLLIALENAWRELTRGGDQDEFMAWLEHTAVDQQPEARSVAYDYLDSLDSFLLSSLHEIEELRGDEIPPDAMEEELIRIWQHTYAFAAAQEEERLRRTWLGRGRGIRRRYPDAALRRRIYKTSLSPRSAVTLLGRADEIRARFLEGAAYSGLNGEDRLAFVQAVLAQLSEVQSFRIETGIGSGRNFSDWRTILQWWLAKETLPRRLSPNKITKWYHFVNQNFIYRGAWGIGSILGVLLDMGEGGVPIRALEIADWPRSGLPWIAFWLKELLTWGTLEPVAAFLLARGNATDRPEAEDEALVYYAELPAGLDENEKLDPRRVRDWVEGRRRRPGRGERLLDLAFEVELEREPDAYRVEHPHVEPIEVNDELIWIDPAGHTLARSVKPVGWRDIPGAYDFQLSVGDAVVRGTPYLPYS